MLTCFDDEDLANSDLKDVAGANEIGRRAADLSDLGLALNLSESRDFLDLADSNIASDIQSKDASQRLIGDLESSRRNVFDPLEARIVDEADGFDSPERMQQEMGRADAAVVQAYDKAMRSSSRDMLRRGVNPNSGKALVARENLNFDRAMASATAANKSAQGLKEKGFGMRMAAAGLGKDKATQQVDASGAALATGQAVINSKDKAISSLRDSIDVGNRALNTSAGAFSNTARIAADASTNAANISAREDESTRNLIGAGLGAWAGGGCD